MFLYEFVVLVLGDNGKSKKIYKCVKLTAISVFSLYVIAATFLSGLALVDNETLCAICLWLISLLFMALYALWFRKIIRDKMDKLHPAPDLSHIDFKGGKLKFKAPNGENIFEITYQNDYTVKTVYKNGLYVTSVQNEAWTVVQAHYAQTREELKQNLIQAIDFAAGQTTAQ